MERDNVWWKTGKVVVLAGFLAFAIFPLYWIVITTLFRSPRSAHEALYRINQFTARRKWGIRFRRNERLEIEPVEVLAADHVSSPLTRATISGRTMLLARCLRVGGATKPKGELRLSDGSLLYVDVTETVARELGKRLYDEVVLSGDAVWDARSGELREFRVVEVSTFRAIPPTIAFKELAEAARGRWDNVDADSYVRQIRESSE